MNKQDKLEEQEYIDLYNKGYGIYQLSLEMAELLVTTKSNNPQIEALRAGAKMAKDENEKSKLPDWLKRDRFKDAVKDKNVLPDKGNEPERD